MESLVDSIADFVRARQLNIAIAGLLTISYLVYQYWGILLKGRRDDEGDYQHSSRLSRSRSRSSSESRSGYHDYKLEDKHGRRGRKAHRRCPDCSLCK